MSRPRKTDKHLPACVYHRHGAYWFVKRGKWVRLDSRLSKALEAYGAMIVEPEGGMASLIDDVLVYIKPTIKEQTYRQYCAASKRLKDTLAEFSPGQVKSKHIAAIKRDMASTPNMANRTLSLLSLVFQHAVEWQLVDTNPVIGIKRHREKKRDRYISDEEYLAIYAKAGDRLQVIMDLLYLTGQRVQDVLEIRYSALKDEGIEFQPTKTKGSTGAKLMVAWTPDLKSVVDRAKTLNGNVRALTLLQGRKGKAPNYKTIQKQWTEACNAAAVEDVQMRDLRAKALTDAKRQGHDPSALAAHASALMTERYIRRREVPLVSGPSFGHPIGRAEEAE